MIKDHPEDRRRVIKEPAQVYRDLGLRPVEAPTALQTGSLVRRVRLANGELDESDAPDRVANLKTAGATIIKDQQEQIDVEDNVLRVRAEFTEPGHARVTLVCKQGVGAPQVYKLSDTEFILGFAVGTEA